LQFIIDNDEADNIFFKNEMLDISKKLSK
jgi:hypothetical protein